MKIALAQMKVIPGLPKENLEAMMKMIERAKSQHADLIAFPEMCIGGYLLGDKWTSEEFCLDLMKYNETLKKASRGIAIAYGNVYVDANDEINKRTGDDGWHPNKDGRARKYNAVYVFQNGREVKKAIETGILPRGIQAKTHLPNYRIFDDERYFFSMKDIAMDFGAKLEDLAQPFLIEIDGRKIPIGFELCEDLWCEDYRRSKKALSPTKMLIENGARYIINLSASPWTYGKNSARDRRVEFLKKESGNNFVPFLYVNCTGAQNNGKNIVMFDGGSTVYNKNGLPVILSKAPYLEELIIAEEKDFLKKPIERAEKPKIGQKYNAIIEGIRYMKDMVGMKEHQRFIIGMSGGIDSSVVAALLVNAVGREKVLGINMPTVFNDEETKKSAAYVAKKLGISYGTLPIQKLVELNQKVIDRLDADRTGNMLSEFNMENLQAKIRGTSILSNIAAKYNAIFTNNGNKDEVSLGYATLYGDWNGAFAPIADLTKAEVVALARYMNNEIFHDEVIPEILIPDELFRFTDKQIKPSPQLKENQVTPIKFGYHCALISAMTEYKKNSAENIMEWYINGTLHKQIDYYLDGLTDGKEIGCQLMQRWQVDDPKTFINDLEWLDEKAQRNVFKRVQAPPIIITSKSAFGYDIRESILPIEKSLRFEELKKRVLEMKRYEPEKALEVKNA